MNESTDIPADRDPSNARRHGFAPLEGIKVNDLIDRLMNQRQAHHAGYYAMYSSWYGGIVTDPRLMLIPFDDHMVHRGDGVFEVFRCIDGALYNLDAHLERLTQSARTASLPWPASREQIVERVMATVRAGGHVDATVRVHLARGPGGFSVDPTESIGPQLYIAVYRTPPAFMRQHPNGARAITFAKPMRPFTRPVIKSCNYLFNVLMKQAARERGADFAVARDHAGALTEGATENVACVTRSGDLLLPRTHRILRGTTVERAKRLARKLVRNGRLRTIRHADCHRTTTRSAAEIILFGTTLPVVAVTTFDGRPVGEGRPGPVAMALWQAVEADMRLNPAMRTPVG